MATVAFQPNGISPATANGLSQPDRASTPSLSQPAAPPSTLPAAATSSGQPLLNGTSASLSTNPPAPTTGPSQQQPFVKPRDIRTMELLLTAQGVSAYETRVPQLLLDFAYRHTSAVLSDALHLSADPYTSHAGARASAASGATASVPPAADASVSANAVRLAIASRLNFQFRGGSGGPAAGGGASKEWLLELARERNRIALPRVGAIEWGARLPSERFVLSGVSWGLRDAWAPGAADEEDEEDEEGDDDGSDGDAGDGADGENGDSKRSKKKREHTGDGDVSMGDAEEDVGGDGVEGGTMGDVFEDDGMEDEMME